MDTNAAQFARMGFPWHDATPEVPVSRASRKIRRAGPNMAKVKPEFREEGYVRRALSAEEERAARHRASLQLVRRLARGQQIQSRHHGSDTPLVDPQTMQRTDPTASWRHANRPLLTQIFDVLEAEERAERKAARLAERDSAKRAEFAEGMNALSAAMSAALGE